MSNPANETSSSSLLPGKLKIPFDFMKKDSSEIDDKKIPGKLKSPIDTKENKDEKENKNIPGKLKNIPEEKQNKKKNQNLKLRKNLQIKNLINFILIWLKKIK